MSIVYSKANKIERISDSYTHTKFQFNFQSMRDRPRALSLSQMELCVNRLVLLFYSMMFGVLLELEHIVKKKRRRKYTTLL